MHHNPNPARALTALLIASMGAVLALVLVSVGLAESPPRMDFPAADALWIEQDLTAPDDSVRFVARWTAPVLNVRNRPLDGYDVEWLYGTVLISARKRSTLTSDSITLPRPPAGDSVGPLSVRVRSRDKSGAISIWLISPPWWMRSDPLPPPPPTKLEVDSASVLILPAVASLTEGAVVQLCAYERTEGGEWASLPNSDGSGVPSVCAERLRLYTGFPAA